MTPEKTDLCIMGGNYGLLSIVDSNTGGQIQIWSLVIAIRLKII